MCLMRASNMPLLGCSDAQSLPVLRFGIGSCHFMREEVTGGLPGSWSCSRAQGFSKGMWCGRPTRCTVGSWGACCPPGQMALASAAPQWPIQSFSSPEASPQPGLERGRVCMKEVYVGREIGKNTLDPQRSLGVGLGFASGFRLSSRRLQLTLCSFPLIP